MAWLCKHFSETLLSVFLVMYSEVELLGQRVILFLIRVPISSYLDQNLLFGVSLCFLYSSCPYISFYSLSSSCLPQGTPCLRYPLHDSFTLKVFQHHKPPERILRILSIQVITYVEVVV